MEPTSRNYSPHLLAAIRRRATELYQLSGGLKDRDLENWCQAEAEILRESGPQAVRRALLSILVE
jgi:hypothetical protein